VNTNGKAAIIFKQGEPQIVVPIIERTDDNIVNRALEIAKTRADMIELRIDYYEHAKQPEKVVNLLRKLTKSVPQLPVIFTLRTKQEGGMLGAMPDEYYAVYSAVIASKLPFAIDIEHALLPHISPLLTDVELTVIVSKHILDPAYFANSYAKVADILRDMKKSGADIVKLAFMASDGFNFDALNAVVQRVKDEIGLYAVIAMGENGAESRTRASELGSCITFMSFGKESAAGQVEI
jgi:3-dehydroquinate dehydratase-1